VWNVKRTAVPTITDKKKNTAEHHQAVTKDWNPGKGIHLGQHINPYRTNVENRVSS